MQKIKEKITTIMEQPLDRACRFCQSLSFWIWTLTFILCMPVIVLFSLGYIFDGATKTFSKTGAVSLITTPDHALISIDGEEINSKTPHTLRGVIPKTYTITFSKEGYFSHETQIAVSPAHVTAMEVTLMPNLQEYEQKTLSFELYKYFVVKRLMDEKLLCFTDKGIYLNSDDFTVEKRITSQVLPKESAMLIKNVKYTSDEILFWSSKKIWALLSESKVTTDDSQIHLLYEARHEMKHVFLGFKNKYILLQDGQDVKAIDIQNPAMIYLISRLKTRDGEIFYNEESGVLYLYENSENTNSSMIRLKDLENNFMKKLQN
jgi:hypothetical protein